MAACRAGRPSTSTGSAGYHRAWSPAANRRERHGHGYSWITLRSKRVGHMNGFPEPFSNSSQAAAPERRPCAWPPLISQFFSLSNAGARDGLNRLLGGLESSIVTSARMCTSFVAEASRLCKSGTGETPVLRVCGSVALGSLHTARGGRLGEWGSLGTPKLSCPSAADLL